VERPEKKSLKEMGGDCRTEFISAIQPGAEDTIPEETPVVTTSGETSVRSGVQVRSRRGGNNGEGVTQREGVSVMECFPSTTTGGGVFEKCVAKSAVVG